MALANYRGMALATGSFREGSCAVQSELYDIMENKWSIAQDYPFAP